MQSSLPYSTLGLHVAIIMDGNGRWATARGLPRVAGHRAGAKAVRRTVEAARRRAIGTLTLYAFSGDNWGRPAEEVGALMRLFASYLASEGRRCRANGIRLRIIGRRDRLAPELRSAIDRAEELTAEMRDMELRIAVDYSAREAILRAACAAAPLPQTRASFASLIGAAMHAGEARDVDLLVRTGGEHRLSDFMLWESAYAELHVIDVAWPDFGEPELDAALNWFSSRQRRFGRLPEAVVSIERSATEGRLA